MPMLSSPEDRQFMNELRNLVKGDVAKYNGDPRYSTDGRRNLIAATYLAAQKAGADAYEKFAAPARAKHREIERKLFGPGSKDHAAVMSWRDACDRADNIDTAEKGQRMFERACIGEDTMLAKAILQRAVRRGWNDVLDSAATQMPEQAELVQDWLGSPDESALAKLKILVYHVGRPTELGDANDTQLQEWAKLAPPELPAEQRLTPYTGVTYLPQVGDDPAAVARAEGAERAQAANDAFDAAANASVTVP